MANLGIPRSSPMNDRLPAWAIRTERPNENLPALLSSSTTAYANHLDWFHKHKDSGTKLLGAVVAAEFAISGLGLTDKVPSGLVAPFLIVLAVSAPLLAWIAVRNCQSSYRASLEHAMLTSKLVWAMGLVSDVAVGRPGGTPPAPSDTTLWVRRFYEHTCEAKTIDDYVDTWLSRRWTTLFLARVTLWSLGSVGFVGGVLLFWVVAFWYSPVE